MAVFGRPLSRASLTFSQLTAALVESTFQEADDLCQVLDADGSQTKAMLEIRTGKHLVIQGPPGTGKSQTITNVLADAVARGKTVLFVAEKRAALDVVLRRLDRA